MDDGGFEKEFFKIAGSKINLIWTKKLAKAGGK
jgi:hypothetical protein